MAKWIRVIKEYYYELLLMRIQVQIKMSEKEKMLINNNNNKKEYKKKRRKRMKNLSKNCGK